MRKLLFSLLFGVVLAGTAHGQGVLPQSSTQHGVLLTWHPSGSAVSGYSVYRCWGTCTAGSPYWIQLSSSLVQATSFLDSSTAGNAPVLNNTYSYVVAAVNSTGTITYSNVVQVILPATWPQGISWSTPGLTGVVE
jgi:hypothetical protein